MQHVKRFLKAPKQSFFLLGPRGTGKTTWIKEHFQNALWIDLLLPEELQYYGARPERLKEALDAEPSSKIVVVDEIQKLPELLSLVHFIIEEKKGHQFILTGSSARKLKRTGVDLLAGRALLKFMHPFTADELGPLFNLERALEVGMLPLVWDNIDPEKVLKTYAALYLKEEIQAEALVRNVSAYARFLETISFSHAGSLNLNNIARESAISRMTISNYLQILEDMLLGYTIPIFTRRAQRVLAAHPKFYFFDAGVYRALRRSGPLDQPEEIQGQALEGLVAQHLRAWIDEQEDKYDLSFWRTRSGVEVDFVVYGPQGFWAIEVKNTDKINAKDLTGLKSFKQDYPEAKTIFLYRGQRSLMQEEILCLPVEEFLKQKLFPV